MSDPKPSALWDLPRSLRYSAATAIAFGLVGGVVGLVLGLGAYPPTAWAAVLEVGVPASYLGAVVGVVAGGVHAVVDRLRRHAAVR